MGVAPGAAARVFPEILDADVMAPNPGQAAVHGDDLAMIAEIELKAVAPPQGGVEGRQLDPGVAQVLI